MPKKTSTVEIVDPVDVPALMVTNRPPLPLSANIPKVVASLEKIVDRYKKMKFTTANLVEVTAAKSAMRSLRTGIEKTEKETKQIYFDGPKKAFVADLALVYELIKQIEDKCDEVIKKEDEKRIDGINLAIEDYIAEFTKDEELRDEYFNRIERKKEYYNKTQAEKDTKNDLQVQITALYKEQKAYDAAVRAVEKACAKDSRLLKNRYINELQRETDIATVLEMIEEDREALNAQAKGGVDVSGTYQTESGDGEADTGEPEVFEAELVEDADSIDFNSDLPDRVKTVLVRFTYPADCADAMSKLMELLWEKGVKSEIVEREA